jgi:hypothetical protein
MGGISKQELTRTEHENEWMIQGIKFLQLVKNIGKSWEELNIFGGGVGLCFCIDEHVWYTPTELGNNFGILDPRE